MGIITIRLELVKLVGHEWVYFVSNQGNGYYRQEIRRRGLYGPQQGEDIKKRGDLSLMG